MRQTYTPEELKTVLEEHKKWLESEDGEEGSRADLSRANLCCADLCCADLSGADLSGANLSGADLSRADLSRADLSRANLSRADLSGANLRHANLRHAGLAGANLSGADLTGADLSDANLSGADLRGADLDMSAWPLWCGGTQTYLDRRRSLQLIYHLFNQHHQDPEIHATLEVLRPLANEFRAQHRTDAPDLRGAEMVLAPNKENK